MQKGPERVRILSMYFLYWGGKHCRPLHWNDGLFARQEPLGCGRGIGRGCGGLGSAFGGRRLGLGFRRADRRRWAQDPLLRRLLHFCGPGGRGAGRPLTGMRGGGAGPGEAPAPSGHCDLLFVGPFTFEPNWPPMLPPGPYWHTRSFFSTPQPRCVLAFQTTCV